MKGHADELILIDRIRRGDKSAFETLYHLYWQDLYAMAFNRLETHEEANEIIQDIFTDLWIKRKKIQINSSLKSYLFSALKYSIIDHIRKSVNREKYVSYILKMNSDRDHSTDELVHMNELQKTLHDGIVALPEKCRQVFEMSRYENFSNKEIAEKLNISSKTVENQIYKALKILREKLSEYLPVLACIITTLGFRV